MIHSNACIAPAFSAESSRFSEDFKRGPQPYNEALCYREEGWHVWCGSLIKDKVAGRYHLFYCRWPVSEGYDAWVTHSEIAHAVGDSPTGPFKFLDVVMPRDEGGTGWDAHCCHNVTVKEFAGKYYLYYMGNRGDGQWWTHRNNQRIGVAVAECIEGPWKRFATPVIDVSPGQWDGLMVSNPTVTDTPDGRHVLIYKGVAEGPLPFGGRVLHGVAWADSPEGPFTKDAKPIFDFEDCNFGFEDPCLWREGDTYFCAVKDMQGVVSPTKESGLVLLQSKDAHNWTGSDPLHLLGKTLQDDKGREVTFERVERPHLFSEPGRKPTLLVAVQSVDPEIPAYNLRLQY